MRRLAARLVAQGLRLLVGAPILFGVRGGLAFVSGVNALASFIEFGRWQP